MITNMKLIISLLKLKIKVMRNLSFLAEREFLGNLELVKFFYIIQYNDNVNIHFCIFLSWTQFKKAI